MADPTITERLVDKLLAIRFDSIPEAAIETAKQTALDGLAVMHAGADEPLGVGRVSTAYVREMGGAPQSSVIAGGFKTSMVNAAYANGSMAHALDFDNTHYPPNHPTSPTLPAILAIAEHYKLPGKAVVEAIVTAHEVQGRVQITHPRFDYVNRPQPKSGLDGKFSVQYTTLAALLDGEVTVETFTNERLFAPDIAALLPRVEFLADDTIPLDKATLHIIVTVWLRDGRTVSKTIDNKVTGWLGSKGNPPTREQRLKKFFACTRQLRTEAQASRMLELIERLDTLPDVVEIMSIACAEGKAS